MNNTIKTIEDCRTNNSWRLDDPQLHWSLRNRANALQVEDPSGYLLVSLDHVHGYEEIGEEAMILSNLEYWESNVESTKIGPGVYLVDLCDDENANDAIVLLRCLDEYPWDESGYTETEQRLREDAGQIMIPLVSPPAYPAKAAYWSFVRGEVDAGRAAGVYRQQCTCDDWTTVADWPEVDTEEQCPCCNSSITPGIPMDYYGQPNQLLQFQGVLLGHCPSCGLLVRMESHT